MEEIVLKLEEIAEDVKKISICDLIKIKHIFNYKTMEEIKTEDVMKIIKILREHEERDLITKIRIHFEELLDEDYVPPKKIFKKKNIVI